MRRPLFNFFAAASLLLCVAVCGLWVRSSKRKDVIQHGSGRVCAFTSLGTVWVAVTDRPFWTQAPRYKSEEVDPDFHRSFGPFFAYTERRHSGGVSRAAAGFVYFSFAQPPSVPPCQFHYGAVPLWFPFILGLAVPIARWRRYRRDINRVRAGLCFACGYDLRATADRCPECGANVSCQLT